MKHFDRTLKLDEGRQNAGLVAYTTKSEYHRDAHPLLTIYDPKVCKSIDDPTLLM